MKYHNKFLLKFSFLGIVIYSGAFLLPQTNALTLREALEKGVKSGVDVRILEYRRQALSFQREEVEKNWMSHQVSGRSGFSRNEVGDSEDATSRAMESTWYTLSYQQQYQNGIYWSASYSNRFGKALSASESDERYNKILFLVMVPIYGKTAATADSVMERQLKTIDQSERQLGFSSNSVKVGIARAFFEAYLAEQKLIIAQNRLELLDVKLSLTTQTKGSQTEIDDRLLIYDRKQLELSREEAQAEKSGALRKLGYLVGTSAKSLTVIPSVGPPDNVFNLDEKEIHYNNWPKLIQLQNSLELVIQQQNLAENQTLPDVQMGGYIGESSLNGTSGSNIGVNVNVSYQFGGGIPSRTSAIQLERSALEHEIEKEKINLLSRQQVDIARYRSTCQKMVLSAEKYRLSEEQAILHQEQFEVGDIDRFQLIEYEIDLLNAQLNHVIAQVNCWSRFLDIAEYSEGLLDNI